ncbi:unnamed protein product [Dimorphilus gyrociliatus]|uniref:C-CAP/cofactor C-like domain-containing protein n=1 Tax=Dimorphilus gyrociliatus TaxID=2664684 RepID=A0A7I8VKF0_9ANNE|nr:unnamed protein product [Dimorphilus gyrociliatus]
MSDNSEDKKLTIAIKIQKRDEERKAEVTRRKDEILSKKPENEKIDVFDSNFQLLKVEIEEKLALTVEPSDAKEHIDDILQSIRKAQKLLTDSIKFVPPVRIAFIQNLINKFERNLLVKEETLKPKKKFAFKKAKKVQGPIQSTMKIAKSEETRDETKNFGFSIEGKMDENITIEENQTNQKDILISNMNNCTIRIIGSPGTLHMVNIDNCTILSGPSSTSVFIELSKNSRFVMAGQQFRIHKTESSDFYIHVTSRAIIEDCNSVRFAPYVFNYEKLDEHYKLSGLDKSVNNWELVNDFNWLTTTKKSPNWDIIPEADRQTFI